MGVKTNEPQKCTEESSKNRQFQADLKSWVNAEKKKNSKNKTNIITAQRRILAAFKTNATLLDLSNLNLYSLPNCIGQLSALTELDVYDNQLTALPDSIGKLSNLTKLFIGHNQLSSFP